MATDQHPYQAICIKSNKFRNGSRNFFFGACGPNIFAVNLVLGNIVARWSSEGIQPSAEDGDSRNGGQPSKKRKLDGTTSSKAPIVIKLVLSPSQDHLVAVTGEDKCIRVLEIDQQGRLTELSQRCMPKRPCSILITPDNKTILCGDKFGDVYSLPLIPGEYDPAAAETEKATPERTYNPSATDLTVHTARNRKALEEQIKRKGQASNAKEPLKFEHQLCLGHVSMLTDMQIGTTEIEGKSRHHIITSDRDEHIRVSRGPPQAHIIERFCMGHTEFISFIRLVPDSNLLVSGGGDDWIGVWDWTTGELIAKHRLREEEGGNIAVSGLWVLPSGLDGDIQVVYVTFEGTNKLYHIPVEELQSPLTSYLSVDTHAPVLDIAATSLLGGVAVASLDTKGEKDKPRLIPFVRRSNGEIGAFESDHAGIEDGVLRQAIAVDVPVPDRKALDSMLYSVGKLRKRGDEDGLEEE
ncbi:hypothetical protein MBLNU457_7704t1 [Dothideomycetes sp. NU457]